MLGVRDGFGEGIRVGNLVGLHDGAMLGLDVIGFEVGGIEYVGSADEKDDGACVG